MSGTEARVRWRAAARADLRDVFTFLLPRNPEAAERVVAELAVACDSLATFPHRGRRGKDPGTRELVVLRTYVVVYRIAPDGAVTILRLWYGAQDRP